MGKLRSNKSCNFRFPDLLSDHIDGRLTINIECAACLLNIVSRCDGSPLEDTPLASIENESGTIDSRTCSSDRSTGTNSLIQCEQISVIDSCHLHMFHESCLAKWSVRDSSCPMCRTRFDHIGIYTITAVTSDLNGDDSTKSNGIKGELQDTRRIKPVFLEDVVEEEESDEDEEDVTENNNDIEAAIVEFSTADLRETLLRQASSVADTLVQDLRSTIRQERMIAIANRSGRGRGSGMDPSKVISIIERNISRLPQAMDDPTVFATLEKTQNSTTRRTTTSFIDPCSTRAPKRLIVRPKGKIRGKPLNLGSSFKLNPKYEDYTSGDDS